MDTPLIFQKANPKRLGSFGICYLGVKCRCQKHHTGSIIGEKQACQFDFDNCLDSECDKIHVIDKSMHPLLFDRHFQI
jgi:hypothetical protein